MWPFNTSSTAMDNVRRCKIAAGIMFLSVLATMSFLLMVFGPQYGTASHEVANSTALPSPTFAVVGNTSNTANTLRRDEKGHGSFNIVEYYSNAFASPTGLSDNASVTSSQVTAVAAFSSLNTANYITSTTFKTTFTKTAVTSEALPILAWIEHMPPPSTWSSALSLLFNSCEIYGTGEPTTMTDIDHAAVTPGIFIAVPSELPAVSKTTSMDGPIAHPLEGPSRLSYISSVLANVKTVRLDEGESVTTTSSSSFGPVHSTEVFPAANENAEGAASTALSTVTHIPTASISLAAVDPTGGSLAAFASSLLDGSTDISSESQSPNHEANTGSNGMPFPTSRQLPSSSLTVLAPGLTLTPTQGVGVSALTSAAAILSTSSSASVTPTLASSFTPLPTQVQSIASAVAPTTASTPILPPTNSFRRLSIGLGVSLSILFLGVLSFIVFWLRTRRLERKKIDELEKNVEWLSPPSKKGSSNGTPVKMINLDGVGVKKIEQPAPVYIDPLAQKPFSEEEIRIAQAHGYLLDVKPTDTSARSPKVVKRRSGGMNLAKQWVDGAMDNILPTNPFDDAYAIRSQPTRLSTITDKSEV
jgi:hypothetical protein